MEEYGSAGRGIRKSLSREQKKHKERHGQTGVRYNTLRAGEGLIVRMAEAQMPILTKSGRIIKQK